ncbi:4-coumarate--CoA ligase-like 7 [Lolium rigidum]|uniref:4-coumarate--CoA ligase-like 7 n=1 Tax=Lolium rigidum TaxID=89674 RepID=UPI001F5CF732|nr:4-coumarate--CoA ligase-like 7 [Lolium rigidum]
MPSTAAAAVDPMSGYCAATGTFHSLREPIPLPPPDQPLSFPAFAFSFLPSPLPAHPALIDTATGEAVSFPAFLAQVRALATALRSHLRVARGDVAFVLAPPGLRLPALYFALMAVGAVVSPANPALTTGELAHLAALSKPSLAFAVSATAGKLPPGIATVLLLDSPRFLSFLQGPGDSSVMDATVIHQSDPAAILYSSGTTGRAKAVVLTHRNLMTSRVMAASAPAAPEVLLLTVPVFHVYGFVLCFRPVIATNTLVLHTARRFDPRAVLEAIGRFSVTRLALAPPALLAIAKTAEGDESVAGSTATLQSVLCGGASVSPELIRRFSQKFPHVCVTQGYGLTETTAGFCRSISAEESRRVGSVGRLSWGTEAKIVDPETGDALPPGVAGELYVRGPFVMKGYLGDKESTSEVLDSEGWLRTGDVCMIGKDGFLFVVDRMKELIKYNSYQVAPAELEDLLQTHPGIDEAAVVGYPDEQAGELPVAFVVGRSGSDLHEAEIKDFIAKQVVHYKRIHRVFLVDSIPKNASGKILRKDLAKLVLHQISAKL